MKRKRIKYAIGSLIISLAVTSLSGCTNNENGEAATKTITISGSTSVGPLMEDLATVYQEKKKNVKIEIQQIGSSAGIKNAIEEVSEIGMSSRDLKDEERSKVKEEVICYDGIAVIVHPNNTVSDLTTAQVKDIFTGRIKNWKELGGSDKPIVVVSREEGSGTRDAFQEILGFKSEEMTKGAQISHGNGAVKTLVHSNENAIGYVSFEVVFKDGKVNNAIKALKIDSVDANSENVIAKTYKVSRPFLLVYKEDKLSKEGKDFIDFIKSEEGQKIAAGRGAIPLK
ncbi:MAG: phosphate ABC transporter substrate-binding protein [Clostridiales bacterium]|nr:phosphate ABC transporter substrate-binding protein [Clostridiales bacterium]